MATWSSGGTDFVFVLVDADTGGTIQSTFGLGADTVDDREENHNVHYLSANNSAFVSYFADTYIYLGYVDLSSKSLVWARRHNIGIDNSVHRGCRYFFYHDSPARIYLTSNYGTEYVFLCLFAPENGNRKRCFKYGSGAGEFPFYMSLQNEFLLLMGSSLSWKSATSSRGTYILNMGKRTEDVSCSALSIAEITFTWEDAISTLPVYSVTESDLQA